MNNLLQEIEKRPSIILQKWNELKEYIDYLILKIKFCSVFADSIVYFDILESIHLLLGRLQFTYHILLPKEAKHFMNDFDSIYTLEGRQYLFDTRIEKLNTCRGFNSLYLIMLLEDLQHGPIKDNIIALITYLREQIVYSFNEVKGSSNLQDAEAAFDKLQKIQEILACLFFKYDVAMADDLREFIRDCDRLDDPWLRENLFAKIKSGNYGL